MEGAGEEMDKEILASGFKIIGMILIIWSLNKRNRNK